MTHRCLSEDELIAIESDDINPQCTEARLVECVRHLQKCSVYVVYCDSSPMCVCATLEAGKREAEIYADRNMHGWARSWSDSGAGEVLTFTRASNRARAIRVEEYAVLT